MSLLCKNVAQVSISYIGMEQSKEATKTTTKQPVSISYIGMELENKKILKKRGNVSISYIGMEQRYIVTNPKDVVELSQSLI